ncbi:MAG: hypothetical protein AAGH81_18095 [Bacteroidota bacterium]
MTRAEILRDIIEGYRTSIRKRYQYQNLQCHYEIPETIPEETVVGFRDFFLDYVYPDYEKRMELDNAFKSLDDYIRQPQKLIQVVLDTSKLIFTHGRHLPKIVTAGLKALKSFRAASKFEHIFIEEAVKNNINPPYDLGKIDRLISLLSKDEIEDFIQTTQSLFETLHNKALMKKIIEIIEYLIAVMKKNEKAYSRSQVKGLEFGLDALKKGNQLFNTLTKEDQELLIVLVTKIERDRLYQIF